MFHISSEINIIYTPNSSVRLSLIMLIDFEQVSAIQHTHYLHLLFTISIFPQCSSSACHDPRRPHSRERWSVCSSELITACDWFVVKGDGRTPLDEMNTHRSIMNNKTTAIMSNYTGSHISAQQTHSLRGSREEQICDWRIKVAHRRTLRPRPLFFL